MIKLLFTTHAGDGLSTSLARLHALPSLQPFSSQARGFVTEFSRRVLQLPEVRLFPELATLAHWFRPAALDRLADSTKSGNDGELVSRGLVFHIAPANVDVLFAYTWLISVLCGNRNVARLSQKASAQRDVLVGILHSLHDDGLFPDILDRTLLITYPHDADITQQISTSCHARVIWGGDTTVARIRSIPLAPLALEVAFPDRFGVAVLNASAIAGVASNDLPELARRFCNDVLWFGQQACSSPRCVYWVGEAATIAVAKSRFWQAVEVQATSFINEPAALVARVTDAHLLAAQGHGVHLPDKLAAYPLRLSAREAGGTTREAQSGHGMLLEVDLNSLDELPMQLDDRDQTVVQHGFTAGELRAFVISLHNRAVDRIVPIGRALDFHQVWDGINLFHVLSREIRLPSMNL